MNRQSHRWAWVCVVLTALCGGSSLAAQEEDPAIDFWVSKSLARPAAAAQVVGVGGDPWAMISLRLGGLRMIVWDEIGFAGESAPQLPGALLRDIRDNRWPPNMVNRPKNEIPPEDVAFYQLDADALVKAFETPLEAFRKSAEDNRHVTFDHLIRTPTKYRGKVIEIKGTLVMLREHDMLLAAQQRITQKKFYEGWVFGPAKRNPICIQFPILPPGLEPSDKMKKDVTFYGYFLATIKYEGGKTDTGPRVLETPLLIGPTVVVDSKAGAVSEQETPFPLIVLGLVLVGLLVMSVVFFLMYFGFQRGDRRIFATLDDIKTKHAPTPFLDDEVNPETGIKASSQLVLGEPPPDWLPEAKPIDPEKK